MEVNIMFWFEKKPAKTNYAKIVLIVLGVVAAVGAIGYAAYAICKKKKAAECDCCCDCDCDCDELFLDDEDFCDDVEVEIEDAVEAE
jgi:uncharacterized membrane protein YebE (DUF533 family)